MPPARIPAFPIPSLRFPALMPAYAGPPVASRPGEVASTLRLLGYLALAIALIVLDHRGGWLSQARAQVSVVTQPLWWLAGLPGRVGTRVKDDAVTRTRLMEENRQLRNELLVANARLTRLSTAAADGFVLRDTGLPGQAELFVEQVEPVLRKRGLFRHEYTGTTLRSHLGLEVPVRVGKRIPPIR